eukprot:gene15781-15939_t
MRIILIKQSCTAFYHHPGSVTIDIGLALLNAFFAIFIEIKDLVAELGISEITARRDLNQLATDGLLYRTHGGAMKVNPLDKPHDFVNKSPQNAEVKDAICRLAATLIKDGDTVFLDCGSGEFDKGRQAVHGIKAIEHIGKYRASKAFLGVDGISVNGLFANSEHEASITTAFAASSDFTCLIEYG